MQDRSEEWRDRAPVAISSHPCLSSSLSLLPSSTEIVPSNVYLVEVARTKAAPSSIILYTPSASVEEKSLQCPIGRPPSFSVFVELVEERSARDWSRRVSALITWVLRSMEDDVIAVDDDEGVVLVVAFFFFLLFGMMLMEQTIAFCIVNLFWTFVFLFLIVLCNNSTVRYID